MRSSENAILLVDDESSVISALMRTLCDEPYQITGCSSGEQALGAMATQRFKVVVSDERMPGMDGAAFLAEARLRYSETVRMMLTGHASVEAATRAVNNGEIYRFLTKPWNDLELRLAVRSAVEKFDLEEENRRQMCTVRRQSQEMKWLERKYPGISRVDKDASGAILLGREIEVSDVELSKVIEALHSTKK